MTNYLNILQIYLNLCTRKECFNIFQLYMYILNQGLHAYQVFLLGFVLTLITYLTAMLTNTCYL